MFAGGVALAALAGMIAAPLSSVYPGMGGSVLIICFVVVVIGGIGSITGALVASLLVGFVDTFGKVFFAEWSGVGVYVLMAIVLVWRPEGPDEAWRTDDATATASRSRPAARIGGTIGGWLVRCGAAAALPLSPYARTWSCKIAIYAIFALSLELLVGVDRPGEPGPRGVPRHRRLRDRARARATAAARSRRVLPLAVAGGRGLRARSSAR